MPKDIPDNYNVAPSQFMSVITEYEDGRHHLEVMKWGLVPSWAKEETGIVVRPEDVCLVHTDRRLNTGISPERIELFFETSKWEGEIINLEPGKCDDLSWHNIKNLPPNMIPLVKNVLTKIAEGQIYSEYATVLN